MRCSRWLCCMGILFMIGDEANGQATYQKPPQQVVDILNAPPPPSLSISPNRETIALLESARYPAIAELAEPMARLAGLRLNPKTFTAARQPRIVGIKLMPISGGEAKALTLPAEARITSMTWARDGKHYAITGIVGDALSLWIGDLSGKLTKIDGVRLNAVLGDDVQWLDDSTLLLLCVPKNLPAAPVAPLAPVGPVVQESASKAAPVRTYQDLLKDAHDEALLSYYGTSQAILCTLEGKLTPLGEPGMISGVNPSPNTAFYLVTRIEKPFSYLYPLSSFPRATEVWDAQGKVVSVVHKAPLQDKVPIEGVPVGPRGMRWLPTEAATLMWAEALDDGDPKKAVPFRDALFVQAAPFSEPKKQVFQTTHRFRGASFLESGDAMIADYDRERRWSRTVQVNLSKPDVTPVVIFDRSAQDRYGDPGSPQTKLLSNGERVIRTLGDKLVLSSEGASPKGDFPFLSLYDPKTKQNEKVFTCRDGYYESVSAIVTDDLKTLIIRRESPTEPGNYYLRVDGKETALTQNSDPFPELRNVKKQILTTKRADGVPINFTLYTPANVKPGEKLPTIFWAYPREFNDAGTAGQVSGSPNRFTTLGGYSHMFFLTQGYAIMDEVSIPIVGPPETANDTFIEQLVNSAQAAIDFACENGPVDRNRIGVGGHSYGAFMTANLLAHSNLFRAGIARSGAYNRTLTPFGFQNERRTFWEAPQIYAKMSPFNSAHKINEPILMIHGQADSNPGTFPVQSERLYQAIRGNGGTVRLVMLPHEDHGYAGRESIEHVLAEQIAWFDKYVKNANPRDVK